MSAPNDKASEENLVAQIVDSLHHFMEEKQVAADIAIISLVSTAGEIVLSLIVAQPELKEAYLKVFNSTVEHVRSQLKQELNARKI